MSVEEQLAAVREERDRLRFIVVAAALAEGGELRIHAGRAEEALKRLEHRPELEIRHDELGFWKVAIPESDRPGAESSPLPR